MEDVAALGHFKTLLLTCTHWERGAGERSTAGAIASGGSERQLRRLVAGPARSAHDVPPRVRIHLSHHHQAFLVQGTSLGCS